MWEHIFLDLKSNLALHSIECHRLATLLEGVNNKFFKAYFKKYILFKTGCFKAEKLVKKVTIAINKCPTTSFRGKSFNLLLCLSGLNIMEGMLSPIQSFWQLCERNGFWIVIIYSQKCDIQMYCIIKEYTIWILSLF